MSDGKQKERARGGWPGGPLWLMKWAVIVALVVLLLLLIVPRGASAWNGQRQTARITGPMPCNMSMVERSLPHNRYYPCHARHRCQMQYSMVVPAKDGHLIKNLRWFAEVRDRKTNKDSEEDAAAVYGRVPNRGADAGLPPLLLQ